MISMRPSVKRPTQNEDDDELPAKVLRNSCPVDEAFGSIHRLLYDNRLENKILFDYAFEALIENEGSSLEKQHKAKLHEKTPTGFNLLMLACQYNNTRATKLLLKCGLNVNKIDKYGWAASDYAWKNGNWRCLLEILKAEATFPKDFDIKLLEAPDLSNSRETIDLKTQIIAFARKVNQLHKSIELGDFLKVESFVKENKKRYAYNTSNQSALTTALIFKKVRVYSFLCHNFYEAGVDLTRHNELVDHLPPNIKESLRTKLWKHLNRPVEDHVIALISKSRDRSGSKENFQKISYYYATLNEIVEIRPILKLASNSKDTSIIFDFNNDGVSGMDPTADDNPSGLTYQKMGLILIGAKRDDSEVLATFAHELTHWAIQLVYKNNCLPFYAENDETREQWYHELVYFYRNFPNLEETCSDIAEVFDHKKYETTDVNKELIVRVPQLIALYQNNTEILDELRGAFMKLFDYFEKNVLQDVENELLLIDQKAEVAALNQNFGIWARSQELKMLSSNCEKVLDLSRSLFIRSHLPELALECVARNESDSKSIFVLLGQVFENTEMLVKAADWKVKPKFIIVDFENSLGSRLLDKKLCELFSKVTTVFISSNLHDCFREIVRSEISMNFGWDDLNDKTQSTAMELKVIFQDEESLLKHVIEKDPLLIQDLPLEDILKQSTIRLKSFYKNLPPAPRVFIDREYYRAKDEESEKWASANNKVIECFHKKLHLEKTVIMADSAGMGKSTSAVHLAKELKRKNPSSWVVFIDLKQHTKAFEGDGTPLPDVIDVNFFSQDLMNLESTFEVKLFESFYKNNKVIFIFDGFDEISPNYKNFVTNFLKSIKISMNLLLVTTRPHCADGLKNDLHADAIELMPFHEDNQIEFLTKYWHHKNMEGDLELKIRKLLEKLRIYPQPTDFYSIPIHIAMLAEMYDDQDLDTVENFQPNTYALYKNFITTKLQIWNAKGPLASDDSLAFHQTFPVTNLLHIFYKLAFEQLFDDNEIDSLNLPEIDEDIINEMIARVGIVAFGSEGRAEFSHRTFAEHFVADFIFNSALSKNPKIRIKELFIETLKKSNFGQVRKFMNDRLESSNSKMKTEALAEYFDKLTVQENRKKLKACEENESFDYLFDDTVPESEQNADFSNSISGILDHITEEQQTNLITFVLKTLHFNIELKQTLAKEGLFKAFKYFESFSTIWNCVESFADESSTKALSKDILFERNKYKKCLLTLALEEQYENDTKVTQIILDIAEKSLNNVEFRMFLNNEEVGDFLFGLAMKKNKNKFAIIWKAVCSILELENQKKLLTGRDARGDTCLHHKFCRDPDGLSLFLEILKRLLNKEEIIKLFTARNFDGHLFIYYAHEYIDVEQFQMIWKFINENTDEATEKELILAENKRNHILLEASLYGILPPYLKAPVNDFIFGITEALLDREENLFEFLRNRGSLNDFVLNTVAHSKELFEKYSQKLDVIEFREILLSKTARRRNIFELLVFNKSTDEAMVVWNMAVERINDMENVTKLLFEGSNFQSNVFRFAVREQNQIFPEILKWCQINLEHKILKRIFFELDNKTTVLHILFDSGEISLIRRNIELVSNFFTPQECQKMFLRQEMLNRDPNMWKIPLQEAFSNRDAFQVTEEVWKAYCAAFDTQTLQKIISGRYFLHGLQSNHPGHRSIQKNVP